MVPRLAALCALVGAAILATAQSGVADDELKVHEWGTFTSIAGADGRAVDWAPLSGPDDLPCFVHRIEGNGSLKSGLIGTVRMETPVLYFYAPQEQTITTEVRFPRGLITEWYPRAELGPISGAEGRARSNELRNSAIAWRHVSVSPHAEPKLVTEGSASHYYAARAVEAAPLHVGTEQEMFLFYRGVGRFSPPISARAREDGAIVVENLTNDTIGSMILFERRGSRIGYRILDTRMQRKGVTIERPPLAADIADLHHEIERLLMREGLYPREAKAMLETWRDGWFEEGIRLLYLVPRRTIDAELPLSIAPRPVETVRVFMGRLEVITPATLDAVEGAIANSDPATLERYGRFVIPILQRVPSVREHKVDDEKLNRLLAASFASASAPACQ
jgi:hypothetical protein